MIRHLDITNWRSYRRLALSLDPGATFIVAPNGIGKTSIVEAARFAIFGRVPTRTRFRSLGATEPTQVKATVDLGDGALLTITRTVTTRRNAVPTVTAAVDGAPLDPEALDRLLSERFGAPVDFLDRLAMVQGSDIISSGDTLDLRAHLGELLGISGIDRTLDDTRQLIRAANTQVGQERAAASVSAEEVARLDAAANDAERGLAAAEDEVATATAQLDQARATVREAERVTTLVSLATQRDADLQALETEAADLVPAEPGDLDAALASVESAATAAVDEQRRRRAELQGRIDAVMGALAELTGATGTCPVCRRPLDQATLDEARAGHEADVAAWRTELDVTDSQEDEAIAQRAAALRARLGRLGPPPQIPRDVVDLTSATSAEQAAVAAVDHAMTTAAAARAEAAAARRDHTAALSAASALDALIKAFERVATLEAIDKALSDARSVLLDEGIEPLAEALEEQWTKLFENRSGLVLAGDGALSRSVSGEALEYSGFSDGERMAAQLLLRIVVLNATTRLPFLWIDEPLEHLDPDARRALALVLARAPGTGPLKQVVMTTYEEPLVRRLSKAVANTHVHFVRPSA